MSENKVQLITYPDSLGGNLKTLKELLDKSAGGPLAKLFPGGVHILPPYPASGDRGFAPIDYLEVDPAFGDWDDIRAIGKITPVLLDLMVNHVSGESPYFQDYLARGADSPHADMFLPPEKIWPGGVPSKEEIGKIFLRRKVPYSTFRVGESGAPDGRPGGPVSDAPALGDPGTVTVWTTFGKSDPSEQIDIDVTSPLVRKMFTDILDHFAEHGVTQVRLDALPYIIKKPGTNCFFVEPEVYGFLEWFDEAARDRDITILPEVHDVVATRDKLADRGYRVYDFLLPYLVLHALFTGDARRLADHLRSCPRNQVTMLDCHDGVPVKPDLDGLVPSAEARRVVETCVERGSNLSLVHSEKYKDADGFDVHQIRGTYYSMLGANDDALVAARAIQLFAPGTPQIYYVGLLAGENDTKAAEEQNDGRAINRHNYSREEIEEALRREVVQRTLRLIRLRNNHPAFDGTFTVEVPGTAKGGEPDSAPQLRLAWRNGAAECDLVVDLKTYRATIEGTAYGYDESIKVL